MSVKNDSAMTRRLMGQRYRLEACKCANCGRTTLESRLVCSECGHQEFEKVTLPFTGVIELCTIIHTPSSKFRKKPFNAGIVKLDNGTSISCQITDCDLGEPKVGDKVRIVTRRIQEDGDHGVIMYAYSAVLVRD